MKNKPFDGNDSIEAFRNSIEFEGVKKEEVEIMNPDLEVEPKNLTKSTKAH